MQQTDTKEMQWYGWLGYKKDPLGIVQEIKTWPYNQIAYAQN